MDTHIWLTFALHALIEYWEMLICNFLEKIQRRIKHKRLNRNRIATHLFFLPPCKICLQMNLRVGSQLQSYDTFSQAAHVGRVYLKHKYKNFNNEFLEIIMKKKKFVIKCDLSFELGRIPLNVRAYINCHWQKHQYGKFWKNNFISLWLYCSHFCFDVNV